MINPCVFLVQHCMKSCSLVDCISSSASACIRDLAMGLFVFHALVAWCVDSWFEKLIWEQDPLASESENCLVTVMGGSVMYVSLQALIEPYAWNVWV